MKRMLDTLRQLEKELSFDKATEIYEWYCKTYQVSGTDEAPAAVRYEVFEY